MCFVLALRMELILAETWSGIPDFGKPPTKNIITMKFDNQLFILPVFSVDLDEDSVLQSLYSTFPKFR